MKILKFIKIYRYHFLVLLALILFGGFLACLLGQDMNGDLLNYHFYNGYAFLHQKTFYNIQAAQLQGYGNPAIDALTYLLITHFPPVFVGMTLGAIQGLNLFLVFEISLIIFKKYFKNHRLLFSLSLLTALFSTFGAVSISEMGGTMTDNITSIFILTAFFLLLISLKKDLLKYSIILRRFSFMLCGVGAGLKMTNFVYVIALLLASLVIENGLTKRIKNLFYDILSIVSGALIVSGYWCYEVWNHFHNPIFPYYNHLFNSPYFTKINFVDGRWFPKTILDKIFLPFKFVNYQSVASVVSFRDARFAILYSLIIIYILTKIICALINKKIFTKKLNKMQLFFWIFIIASYIIWEIEFSAYRYLLVIELLVLIAIGDIIFSLIKYKAVSILFFTFVLLFITEYTVPMNWGRDNWQNFYFGPNLYQQFAGTNGTILMAKDWPMSFLIPYLPSHDRVIRIESNLTLPGYLTVKNKSAIDNSIVEQKNLHTKFFAIETNLDRSEQIKALKLRGFSNGSCKHIITYVDIDSEASYKKHAYSLCRLISS